MTQPEFTSGIVDPTQELQPQIQEQASQSNRFEMLPLKERIAFIAALAIDANFDTNNDLARQRLRMTYDGLPKKLSTEEIGSFGYAVGIASVADAIHKGADTGESKVLSGRETKLAELKANMRAVYWLGNMSHLHGDDITAHNAVATLGKRFGIRGKRDAVFLWSWQHLTN